jgi:hypothetical protein
MVFRRVANGWSGGRGNSGNWFDQAAEAAVLKTKETVWNYAWSYPDQLKALEGHQAAIEAVRKFKTGELFRVVLQNEEKKLKELGIIARPNDSDMLFNVNDMDLRSLFSHSILSLQSLLRRLLVAEAGRRMAVTAIALKRYHLLHGSYPGELRALVPDLLPGMIADPVDGKNFRYRLNPEGTFLLYSMGEDGEDNGGDASSTNESQSFSSRRGRDETRSFSWLRGRDLVWPQPATQTEIAAHYQKMAVRRVPGASAEAFAKRHGLAPTNGAGTNSVR